LPLEVLTVGIKSRGSSSLDLLLLFLFLLVFELERLSFELRREDFFELLPLVVLEPLLVELVVEVSDEPEELSRYRSWPAKSEPVNVFTYIV